MSRGPADIPQMADWSKAVAGNFYRPIKKSLTNRNDADVLAWLKGQGGDYQTRINALLRGAMLVLNSSVRRKSPKRGKLARQRKADPPLLGPRLFFWNSG